MPTSARRRRESTRGRHRGWRGIVATRRPEPGDAATLVEEQPVRGSEKAMPMETLRTDHRAVPVPRPGRTVPRTVADPPPAQLACDVVRWRPPARGPRPAGYQLGARRPVAAPRTAADVAQVHVDHLVADVIGSPTTLGATTVPSRRGSAYSSPGHVASTASIPHADGRSRRRRAVSRAIREGRTTGAAPKTTCDRSAPAAASSDTRLRRHAYLHARLRGAPPDAAATARMFFRDGGAALAGGLQLVPRQRPPSA